MTAFHESNYYNEGDCGQIYVEILKACKPFYSMQPVSSTPFTNIPARLEDGLTPGKNTESGVEKPHDDATLKQ